MDFDDLLDTSRIKTTVISGGHIQTNITTARNLTANTQDKNLNTSVFTVEDINHLPPNHNGTTTQSYLVGNVFSSDKIKD